MAFASDELAEAAHCLAETLFTGARQQFGGKSKIGRPPNMKCLHWDSASVDASPHADPMDHDREEPRPREIHSITPAHVTEHDLILVLAQHRQRGIDGDVQQSSWYSSSPELLLPTSETGVHTKSAEQEATANSEVGHLGTAVEVVTEIEVWGARVLAGGQSIGSPTQPAGAGSQPAGMPP